MARFTDDNVLKTPEIADEWTEVNTQEFIKCSLDAEYFICKYVTINTDLGPQPFILFEYQRNALRNFLKFKNNVLLFARQLGKTELVAAYILWLTTFHSNKTVLVVANKQEQAIEVLDRIKFMYKNLPNFLRDVVIQWAAKKIVFRNNSRIVCRATTPDAGRGLTISLLYIDELAFVRPDVQKEMLGALRPTLGTKGRMIITSTPGSDEDEFAQIWRGSQDNVRHNGELMDVGRNGFRGNFAIWKDRPDKTVEWAESEQKVIGDIRFKREHECQFISFNSTLIDPMVLARLEPREPISRIGDLKWFSMPQRDHAYFVVLDPSLGVRRDSAAIQVIEMPSLKHIAEWSSNDVSPKGQVKILYDILHFIHMEIDPDNDDPDIFWSFENNSIGETIAQILEESDVNEFPGTLISEKRDPRRKGRLRKGMNTTAKNKLNACTKFKSLVDTERFKPLSQGAIQQLKNFTANNASFAAKGSGHDDIVIALILAIRLLEMTKNRDIFDPEIIQDAIEKEYREPYAFIL